MRRSRSLSAALLGLLLLIWGPCPGLWAQSVSRLGGEPVETRCDCGCGSDAAAHETPDAHETGDAGQPLGDRPAGEPLDRDCPFCSLHNGRAEVLLEATVQLPRTPLAAVSARTEIPAAAPSAPRVVRVLATILRPPRDGPLGEIAQLL